MRKILYSIDSVNRILRAEKPSKVCIVTSSSLLKGLHWAIAKIDFPKIMVAFLPDGEAAKEWAELEKLLKKFIQFGLDRNSVVVALGGGTIGDVAGFASAVYLRGIRYIQVPTTLLAQVDSAHGGKTGINFLGFKNQIGSFYPPIAAVVDMRFIASLPKEQVIDGLGEIIKAGFIKDPLILGLLKKESISTILKSSQLRRIIDKTIKVKQFYERKDPKDLAARQVLNFGHTIGHAIELKYGIGHGRAIIMGMLGEMAIGEALRVTPGSVRKNLIELLKKLNISINTKMKPSWESILHDKKITGADMLFPVIEKEGRSKVIRLKLQQFRKLIKK